MGSLFCWQLTVSSWVVCVDIVNLAKLGRCEELELLIGKHLSRGVML